ncbi:MAG: entericidin A/B family lipoprotein [Aeromonas popoffii]
MKHMKYGLLFCCVLLMGCNTVSGIGRDIEKAGEVIQRSASK